MISPIPTTFFQPAPQTYGILLSVSPANANLPSGGIIKKNALLLRQEIPIGNLFLVKSD